VQAAADRKMPRYAGGDQRSLSDRSKFAESPISDFAEIDSLGLGVTQLDDKDGSPKCAAARKLAFSPKGSSSSAPTALLRRGTRSSSRRAVVVRAAGYHLIDRRAIVHGV
jgi:hypothetical protein